MTIENILNAVNAASAFAALVAAWKWYQSATLKVPYEETKQHEDWVQPAIIDGNHDVVRTLAAQAKFSRDGALYASFAAAAQGISVILGLIAQAAAT